MDRAKNRINLLNKELPYYLNSAELLGYDF